jgi:hypothetical protein
MKNKTTEIKSLKEYTEKRQIMIYLPASINRMSGFGLMVCAEHIPSAI